VRLEWYGRFHEDHCEGLNTHQGRLAAGAGAMLKAAMAAAGKEMHAELIGVKAVRAFDGWVVVARLNAETGGKHMRLLGAASCEAEEELPNQAVLAVLDATNRLFGAGAKGTRRSHGWGA
jgi:hypothetical protein